jgi:predicted  nucleic acid-binding Zn-ribbon protein
MSRAQVADLHGLQQLDTEIERATIEGEALRRALAADPTEPARAAQATSERAAEASTTRMRQAEATLEDTRERLKRQEARLYGGQVSAKDLGKAQQEIEHLQTLRASQEDALLAAMMDAEEAQAAATARAQALAEAERARDRDRSDQTTRLEQVTARLEHLRAERGQRVAALAPELLARYEALRRSHGGRAVAEVRGNVCSACRVTLTPATLQRARIAGDLPLCDNCGRILYLP